MKKSPNRVATQEKGIVYLLELVVDDEKVQKIGITTRKIEDRVVEILSSHFQVFRHYPYCYPKRFKSTTNIMMREAKLLSVFSNEKFTPSKQFSGSTELIKADLDTVVQVYEYIIGTDEWMSDDDIRKEFVDAKVTESTST
jgi:hypothetical protein